MKTEHRHELETNDLAKRMAVWIEAVKPYSKWILASLGLLLGMYLATSYWGAQRAQEERDFWEAYQPAVFEGTTSLDYDAVRLVAESEDFSVNGQEWAYLTWADRQLFLASRAYLMNRDVALEEVNSILGIYEQLSTSASSADARNRAQFGLARCLELQNKPDQAADAYSKVRGAFQAVAQKRLQALDSKDRQAAIEWLATAELPSANSLGGGMPGVRPGFAADLPQADPAEEDRVSSGSIEELLGKIEGDEEGDVKDRYEEDPKEEAAVGTEAEKTKAEKTEPVATEEVPSNEGSDEVETETEEEDEPAAATEEK
ncbi:hypothetical protein [Adhaeretor mobilis]|uniref:Tetratricopeptide repeat-like domain-containing protein n=1 Tax=Adhaeretor mobilis TaxID=1930276 RepID=A0A517MVR2_9BACT|nr:hypothetical protein [Adhaeretor mobilis]QDS98958.1 hypothetical protein HG15A2_22460 [Adhaeretor mobilis]